MGIAFGEFTKEHWPLMASWSYGGFAKFAERLGPQKPGSPLARLQNIEAQGKFTWEECAEIVPALLMAVIVWDEHDYDRIQAIRLVEQMKGAAALHEDLPYG